MIGDRFCFSSLVFKQFLLKNIDIGYTKQHSIYFPIFEGLYSLCLCLGGLCSFVNSKDDDFDWTRDRAGTPSVQTGPSVDHTQGNSNGNVR